MITMTAAPASPKQLAFARSLYAEYANIVFSTEKFTSLPDKDQALLREIHAEATAKLDTMGRREISEKIDSMKGIVDRYRAKAREAAPKAIAPTPALNLEPGMYKVNGTVYQVRPNREGTRLYAKKLVEFGGERLTETDDVIRMEFEYAPGAIYNISPDNRMSLEEGKALIIRYGKCICCGRKLKAAKSVEAGIGPICVKYFN
jgi:hypothetical protein